jgi:hypothetical protein
VPVKSSPHRSGGVGRTGCTSNADCDPGFRCAISAAGTETMCMKDDDMGSGSPVDLPVARCTFSSDCPPGFRCDRDAAACVK